ncbi:MAG: hypothetical protein ACKOW8_06755, partial [Flavobacteriales bacterium]
LTGGNYTVVVTDALGCEYSASQALIPNAELNATFNIDVTNLSCPGADNGALALVSVSGAGAITSLEWTLGNIFVSADSTITGLASGLYTISITDINGCETEASRFVGVNTFSPDIQLAATPSSCLLVEDGTVSVASAVLTAPIASYLWTDSQGEVGNASSISNLAAGEYCVVITDNNNCSAEECTNVLNSNTNTLNLQLVATAAFCQGSNSGAINGTLTGQTGVVTFAWEGPNGFAADTNTASLSALEAGEYCITATDALGCFVEECSTVLEPTESTIAIQFSNTPGFCERSEDGEITVTLNGGTTPILYNWTGPNNFQSQDTSLTGIIAGEYCLTVTDAGGCEANACTTLGSVNSNVIDLTLEVTSASCIGSQDGAIDATISDNTGLTTATWTGPTNYSNSSIDITNLISGTYCLEVVDELGCLGERCDVVGTSGLGDFNLEITVTDVNCSGPNSGSISVSAVGTTSTLTYEWLLGTEVVGTTSSLDNIATGTYCVTATDPSGCQSSACDSVGVDLSTGTTLTLITSDLSCPGSNDGSISAIAAPTGNYTYDWQ